MDESAMCRKMTRKSSPISFATATAAATAAAPTTTKLPANPSKGKRSLETHESAMCRKVARKASSISSNSAAAPTTAKSPAGSSKAKRPLETHEAETGLQKVTRTVSWASADAVVALHGGVEMGDVEIYL